MNAVKNCLVVLAAAVALASCSADPTKDQAGKNLTLTVTPGSINTRAGDTVEVFASALDPLGGAANGNFTITGGNGANFTATIDSTYDAVYSGDRPQARTRIVIAALHASNGSFTISGTGGNFVVPVRIAPDSANGEAAISKTTLAAIDTFTVTLPSGIRVTSGFGVGIYHNALGGDSALFSPVVTAVSADSATLTIAVGPNSGGRVRISDVANATTPTLTYAMRTATQVSSPTLDTSGTDITTPQVAHVTLDKTTPAVGDTVTATAPAGWHFTPATTVHLYKGPAATDSSDGQGQPFVVGIGPDSSTFKFVPAPSGQGQARFTNMILTQDPAYAYAAVRSLDTLTVPPLASTGTVTFTRANNLPNTKVAITMPAGYKFSATSTASVAGATLAPILLGTSASGDTLYALMTPSSSGKVTFTGVKFAVFSGLGFSSTNSLTTAAVTDQGNDNPSAGAVPIINMPIKGSYGIWDLGSFTVQDSSDDNGFQFGFPSVNSQVYQLTLGVAATIKATVTYPSASADVDVVVLQGSGSTNLTDVSAGGTAGAHPEVSTAAGLSAGTYLLDLLDWGGDPSAFGPGAGAVGATLRIVVVAQ